jgi:hypothetical protein
VLNVLAAELPDILAAVGAADSALAANLKQFTNPVEVAIRQEKLPSEGTEKPKLFQE